MAIGQNSLNLILCKHYVLDLFGGNGTAALAAKKLELQEIF
jgi:hypothetical protein